ncbi:MAG: tRNA uridine-5-carboxymethylaminomethyl(34) synthesis GTPase MnmE [Bacteroidales bacterium]|nr:tRNA uridine-5-carboxymethylaminomethyl(34) synthesis GTPase MnmE [Bacteroidales bacterium]
MLNSNILNTDTICAIATPHGMGAIAVIRISGSNAFAAVTSVFQRNGNMMPVDDIVSHKALYGHIIYKGEMLDEVLVTFFKAPHSFTGEDSAEISVHGSVYVQQRLLQILIAQGCRMAEAGEFTRRAFVNRKFDLAQAEAIADLISSESEAAHRVAINQLKGGFSKELQVMRSKLLEMTSLMELELDFSEEDVEFADRSKLKSLLQETLAHVDKLKDSFRLGNAIKNGIPVAIVGQTNTGKSTLLNALLGEDRAIVSDIAGTTRDTIEETLNINGILYRFIDTAGLRSTDEMIEKIGIERSYKKITEANIVIGMLDATTDYGPMLSSANEIRSKVDFEHQQLVLCINKVDTLADQGETLLGQLRQDLDNDVVQVICLSAKHKFGLNDLYNTLKHSQPLASPDVTLVTNMRHYEALLHASESLKSVQQGLEMNIPTDLISQDLRQALHYLGSITGEITTDEVLGSIFSRFCIGK